MAKSESKTIFVRTNHGFSRVGEVPIMVYSAMANWEHKGHEQFFVYGKKGAGKSRCCLINGYLIGNTLFKNFTWDDVLEHVIFSRRHLEQKLEACFAKDGTIIKRYPFLIFDDFGVNNQTSKKYDEYLDELTRLFQVLRSLVCVLIVNAPSFDIVSSKMKVAGDWRIARVSKWDKDRFLTKYYQFSKSPNKVYFACYRNQRGDQINEMFRYDDIPEDISYKYEHMRDSYAYEAFKRLRMARKIEEIKGKAIQVGAKKILEQVNALERNPIESDIVPNELKIKARKISEKKKEFL